MAAAAGTWAFSLPVLNKMRALLLRDASATDCVQEAMADIENDEETGSYVVGRGGYPNKDGLIQCDAAIMEGHPCHFGAVAALSGVGTPLAVARKVMERNTHSFLVGDGAAAFAREQGFIVEDNESMMTEWSAEVYKGLSPMDACQTVLEDILQRVGKENMFELGIIAMNMKGEAGAASSMPFPYCIWSQGQDSIEELMQQPCKL